MLVAENESGRLVFFSACYLELPVGAEGPSHCCPLGPGLVF